VTAHEVLGELRQTSLDNRDQDDRSLAPDDAMRRVRHRFGVYDGLFDDDR
jgi:hypothetical protein